MITKLLATSSAALAFAAPAFAQDATSGEWVTAYSILAGVAAVVVLLGISAYNFERRRH
jgi:hypothetical protein